MFLDYHKEKTGTWKKAFKDQGKWNRKEQK